MRRADRLFRIVQRLRRPGVVTASRLAEALGVSARTVYRDIRDLSLSGVPVQGEAGVGYALPKGFDLPPLMFTEEEIEALVLGARVAQSWGDADLARAAEDALGKIESVLPGRLRERLAEAALFAPGFHVSADLRRLVAPLRRAIRDRRRARFGYQDRAGAPSERTVQPLGLFYWGNAWTLGAWCETRRDFRNFRLDRMARLDVLEERFEPKPGRSLADFFRRYEQEARPRR